MMTQIIEEKIWTYEDYLNLADDKTCEILGGRLSMMVPAPEFNHQLISARMQFLIMRFVEKKDLGYVVDAPTDVVLDELKLRESHKAISYFARIAGPALTIYLIPETKVIITVIQIITIIPCLMTTKAEDGQEQQDETNSK